MKRETVLWMLALLSLTYAYLMLNAFGALFALFLTFYLVHRRMSFQPKIKVRREVKKNFEEGAEGVIDVFVENFGSKVKLRVMENALRSEKLETVLNPGEKRRLHHKILPEKKGEYILDTRVEIYDPDELYYEELSLDPVKVNVLPSLESIKKGAKERIRIKETYKKSFFGLESLEFDELREYTPGDDLKRIDWKASSRLGELIVRDFLKEESRDVYLVLDMTREMRKRARRAKIDYAVSLLLYLASMLVKDGYRVGFIGYQENRYSLIKPSHERTQIQRIRSRIQFKRDEGLLSLKFALSGMSEKTKKFLKKVGKRGLEEALLSVKTPSHLIIITDLMSHTSQLYLLISKLSKKHRIIILSPNPILFYSERLERESLKRLYEGYVERDRILKKFSSKVPVVDLGPGDYEEIIREVEL